MKPDKDLLIFSAHRLAPGLNRFDLEVDPQTVGLGIYDFLEPLRCVINLRRTADRIDLGLELKTRIKLRCSRCGEVVDHPVDTLTRVTYLPEVSREDEEEIDAADLEYYVHQIDLSDVIRDSFILSLPIAVLCREDCKGLCPVCGKNLNKESCDCDRTKINSPFQDLRRIIDE